MSADIGRAHPPTVAAQLPRGGASGGAFASFARSFERAFASVDAGAPGAATGRARGTAGAPEASPLASREAAQLLELQSRVFADARRLELASKLVDHGVGAVKTILQTRV